MLDRTPALSTAPAPSPAPAPRAAYDPRYDPLTDAGPGRGRDYAPTYWIGTAGPAPEDDGPVTADIDVEVAVIGSGYTGLSTAIHLARDHGIEVAVLEANAVAWGCSTRNGGQAQISAGRLKRSEWIKRWGTDTARAMHAEIVEAFDVFNALDLMENTSFLEKLKFGIGDGNLQYYLYNWKCPAMVPKKIGLVLQ